MIKIKQKGDFSIVTRYLARVKNVSNIDDVEKYAKEGLVALSAATPKDTGLTAASWEYVITKTKNSVSISYKNSNIQNGVPIAIILQYGHLTGSGYWVEGVDYINPALKPVFEKIAKDAWEEVTKV